MTKSETHTLVICDIFDQPEEYKRGNQYGTLVNHDKNLKKVDGKQFFIINVMAQQMIENVGLLAMIHSVSEYELSEHIENNIVPKSLWQPLVIKSVEACNKLYKERVKDTYLQGTDIPNPTIAELAG